jgi:hypothetical protein
MSTAIAFSSPYRHGIFPLPDLDRLPDTPVHLSPPQSPHAARFFSATCAAPCRWQHGFPEPSPVPGAVPHGNPWMRLRAALCPSRRDMPRGSQPSQQLSRDHIVCAICVIPCQQKRYLGMLPVFASEQDCLAYGGRIDMAFTRHALTIAARLPRESC